MQIPVGIWTAGVMYLFARHFGLRRANAFFIAGVFFLTPIVVAQMGTDYIDLTSAGFLLSSVYLTVRFLGTSRTIYSFLAFLSIAAMIGMKYHLLFSAAILLLIFLFILIQKRRFMQVSMGILVVIFLGLGWHLRNYIYFSDWTAPTREVAGYCNLQFQSAGTMLLSVIKKVETLFLSHKDYGTVYGGFGAIYALLVFLSYFFFGWCFLLRRKRWAKGEVLLYLIVMSMLGLLVSISDETFPCIGPRILLVVWPIMLIIFWRSIFILNKRSFLGKVFVVCCLLGLALDSRVTATAHMPHHHWWGDTRNSEFKAYRYSTGYVVGLGPIAAALDEMTRSLHRPSTIFLAFSEPFYTAPFYGRFLQTHIVNFDPDFKGEPDFLVYVLTSSDEFLYVGSYKKTLPEARVSKYLKVYESDSGIIFAHPRIMAEKGWKPL
ncbi:MAG: hypothetical protein HQL19_08740 [Candidatus Omnitrophica bacterium]|nr:hypothetical protein [Candidatus Omnitrophota bacterium]